MTALPDYFNSMPNDVLYTILLVISVGSGLVVRRANPGTQRQLVCTAIGIGLITFSCGREALHPLIVTLGNCFLILIVGSRYTHISLDKTTLMNVQMSDCFNAYYSA